MKKILAIVLAAVLLCAALAGCGSSSKVLRNNSWNITKK